MTQPIHPMLERVARAMCKEDGLDPDEHIVGGQAGGFEDFGPLWQAEQRSEGQLGITDYVRQARAAIQALLEPDEGMVEAGEDAMIYPDGDFIRNQAETVFQAMLKPLLGDEGALPRSEEKPHQSKSSAYDPDDWRA